MSCSCLCNASVRWWCVCPISFIFWPCPSAFGILVLSLGVQKKKKKASLKLSIQTTKVMSSGPVTSWQIEGEKVEAVTDFIFLSSKITVDGDHSQEMKRHLLLGRKTMTNLDSILKSKDITFQTKVCLVKAMVFPLVMYGCEGWTIKKAKCQRMNSFKLWCWRRLLESLG